MRDEEIELLNVDDDLEVEDTDKNEMVEALDISSDEVPKKKTNILIILVSFILTVISSFFLFFINLFWEIVYNIIIFLPFLIGKREFPKVRTRIDRFKEKPEIVMIVLLVIVCAIVLINFIVPNSPFRVTSLPEEAVIEDDSKDKVTDEKQSAEDDKNKDNKNSSGSTELYKQYQSLNMNEIDIAKLKEVNSDTVGWIRVDQTYINYPVLQTTDNDYYIDHNFYKKYNKNGWIFGDYRNTWDSLKKNTVIYGHHLLNKTMFGSISNLFTEDWQKNSNHLISLKIGDVIYNWAIFSVYEIPTELYYLANEFTSEDAYRNFVSTLKKRTIYDFNVDVSNVSNILTLSTCNDSNNGRLVVHAALISS